MKYYKENIEFTLKHLLCVLLASRSATFAKQVYVNNDRKYAVFFDK